VKRSVLGLVSVLALAIAAPMGAANAADLAARPAPPPPPPMAPIPVYFNWTGFYVGGNFGGGWANDSISGTSTFAGTTSTFSGNNNYSGILGGGQIGANYEFPNNWVIGFEADVDGSGLSGSTTNCATNAVIGTVGCSSVNTKINDFGTVRARLGYAANNVLFYGTGGWAWGQSSTTSSLSCVSAAGLCPGTSDTFTGGSASASTTATNGWAAGAGVEWAFNRNWMLRVEYLHLQFNGIAETFTSSGTDAGVPFTSTSSSSTNSSNDIVRVGVNYLFH
jgi:outer membrane immunogenic protein